VTVAVYRPGQPGYIVPGSDEHRAVISPSKVAAILGVSRWESPFRLWHRMKGLVADEPNKEAFDIGHDMEPYAANRWRRKNPGWYVSVGEVQFAPPVERFGFPVVCTLDRRASRGRSRRVLEAKIARTLTDIEQWGDDLTGDLPEDYSAQVTAQMLFTGWTKLPGHLIAIGPYFNERIYEIGYDTMVADWIVDRCADFYASLSADGPPPLDNSVATYECVRELHPDIDGTTISVDAELAVAVHDASHDMKAADERLRGLKTQLLAAMGNAQYAVIGDPKYAGALKVATRSPHARGGVSLNLARTHPAVQAAGNQRGNTE